MSRNSNGTIANMCPSATLTSERNPQVLVLGDDTRIVISVARSLGRQNVAVDVAWCGTYCPSLRSRYVRQVHDVEWPRPRSTAWHEQLRGLLATTKYDLVLPVTEAAVYAMQTDRAEFAEFDNLYLLPEETYRVASSKRETYRLAERLGVPIPQTDSVDTAEDLARVLPDLRFPVIVKPICPVEEVDGIDKHYARSVDTADELRAYWARLTERGARVLLQEYFEGVGVGVEVLVHRGVIRTAFQHQRIHETNGHGSTYRKGVPVSRELLDATGRLLGEMQYTGVAMVEYRVDPATGAWRLIEINPRFWGSLPLAVASGADFPYFLFQQLCESGCDLPQAYRTGLRSRDWTYDLIWLWSRLTQSGARFQRGQERWLGWKTNAVSWPSVLLHTLRGLFGRDGWDTFAWDDPGPARAEVRKLVGSALRRCRTALAAGGASILSHVPRRQRATR
ncbi:MAG: ATP-grasp domain-containing protein [Planctomycetota bacterium]|nr:MAG: ATP-grasp domain-containing protein [Planctomycetota bacterium]REK39741.1 MAG: ATP-grasp domain-containing protein [Planctomycetota bacterium]